MSSPSYNGPSRKIRPSRGKNLRGKVISLKMGGQAIPHESSIERDVIHLLEFSDSVKEYYYQPYPIIPYEYNGRMHKYYPDFKVILKNGAVGFIEAKPFSELLKPEIRAKIQALEQYCLENNCFAKVLTERDIRVGKLIDNIRFLKPYRRKPRNADLTIQEILTLLKSSNSLTISDTVSSIKQDMSLTKFCIYNLIYHKRVSVDLKESISSNTLITLNNQENSYECSEFQYWN